MEGFDSNGFRIYGAPIVRPVVPQNLHEAHVLAHTANLQMQSLRAFYSRPQDQISRDLVAIADDNRARGWTND